MSSGFWSKVIHISDKFQNLLYTTAIKAHILFMKYKFAD